MTLPPERIGDRGQQFVMQTKGWPDDTRPDEWQNCAYSNTADGARKAEAAIKTHPCVTETRVIDRNPLDGPVNGT